MNLTVWVRSSFPDEHVRLGQLVAEGDLVAVLATYSGTQTGPMGDLLATGKKVQAPFLVTSGMSPCGGIEGQVQ